MGASEEVSFQREVGVGNRGDRDSHPETWFKVGGCHQEKPACLPCSQGLRKQRPERPVGRYLSIATAYGMHVVAG